MTDDFDDDVLRDAIRARAGGPVPTATGRQAVLSRAARTRTRRTLAIGGTTTFVMIAGLILLAGADDTELQPSQQPGATLPAPSVESSPSTTDADVTTTSSPVVTAPTTSAVTVPTQRPTSPSTTTAGGMPAPTPTTSTSPSATPTTNPPSSTATATSSPTSIATSLPTSTESPTTVPSSTSPPADAPFTRTYDSLGGSITVRWDGAALTLLAVDPNAGYESEIEDQSASRIRVRFRSDAGDSRIEVRVDDGRVVSSIS